ncbi:MAG: sporulation transcriptional regulator SpoIIID [Clostridia bacterium]|nr:sporulation transcriptional regulator SpoIIID [Clostridia bacterium]
MKVDFDSRTLYFADVFISEQKTIRQVASKLQISKTTLHVQLTKRLPNIDNIRYREVRKILDKNKKEAHMRGGLSTKEKYKRKEIK